MPRTESVDDLSLYVKQPGDTTAEEGDHEADDEERGGDRFSRAKSRKSSAFGVRRSSSVGLVLERSKHLQPTGQSFKVTFNYEQASASFIDTSEGGLKEVQPTLDAGVFEEVCQPFDVSGGTARFFEVRLRPEHSPEDCPPDKFIGKDISRAQDEASFYIRLQQEETDEHLARLQDIALECLGVARLECAVPGRKNAPRTLLVLENLRSGFGRLRMCDIKIGEETALANWKGKGWLSALGSAHVDEHSNSIEEGLRLEGMDNAPPSLTAKLHAATDTSSRSGYMRMKILGEKPSHKFLLQQMRTREFLSYWLDLSHLGEGYERRSHKALWGTLIKLTEVVRVLANLQWPQMWIGASVSLGLEAGDPVDERWDYGHVFVKLLDWGRAELSTEQTMRSMSRQERKDSIRRWQQFITACCQLQWEATRLAKHRCCCPRWTCIVFEVLAEHISVFGALLSGAGGSNVQTTKLGTAMVDLSEPDILGSDCWLTLYSPTGSGVGTVCVRISIVPDGDDRIIRIQFPRVDLDSDRGADLVVVRVIAFEHEDDATNFFEAERSGSENAPMPRGFACPQITKPGTRISTGYVWHGCLEFVGLGEAGAAEASANLRNIMPELFPRDDASLCDKTFQDLPAYWCWNQREQIMTWSKRLVPWFSLDGGCPPEWRTFPQPYAVGEEIEYYRAALKAWVPAIVSGVDIVAVSYANAKGGHPIQKQLPASHPDLQPVLQSGQHSSPFYCVGDEVSCYSTSSKAWVAAKVIEADLVILTYEGEGEKVVSKRLPSQSSVLRKMAPALDIESFFNLDNPFDRKETPTTGGGSTARRLSGYLDVPKTTKEVLSKQAESNVDSDSDHESDAGSNRGSFTTAPPALPMTFAR